MLTVIHPNPLAVREEGWTQQVPAFRVCALSDLFGETSSEPKRLGPTMSLHDRAEDKVRKYKQAEPPAPTGAGFSSVVKKT